MTRKKTKTKQIQQGQNMKADETVVAVARLIMVAIIIAVSIGWKLFSASQEAATYNKITGANVTTYDALWVELRVDSQPKKRD